MAPVKINIAIMRILMAKGSWHKNQLNPEQIINNLRTLFSSGFLHFSAESNNVKFDNNFILKYWVFWKIHNTGQKNRQESLKLKTQEDDSPETSNI